MTWNNVRKIKYIFEKKDSNVKLIRSPKSKFTRRKFSNFAILIRTEFISFSAHSIFSVRIQFVMTCSLHLWTSAINIQMCFWSRRHVVSISWKMSFQRTHKFALFRLFFSSSQHWNLCTRCVPVRDFPIKVSSHTREPKSRKSQESRQGKAASLHVSFRLLFNC